jgi:hypothetical protein
MQWPKEKGQTVIYKALHRKLKIQQHGPHLKPKVNSGAPEGLAIPATHVDPFLLLFSVFLLSCFVDVI